MRKLPKVTRLDQSDTHVFATAAAPGEWAVSGAFAFADASPESIKGAELVAFGQSFLGLVSFGRATLVQVSEADDRDIESAIVALARHFVSDWGAPDMGTARPVAEEEVAFAEGLCADLAPGRLLTVEREFGEDGIVEKFRAVDRPKGMDHSKIWTMVPDNEP